MKRIKKTWVICESASVAVLLMAFVVTADDATDDFSRRSTWAAPDANRVRTEVNEWFDGLDLADEQLEQYERIWSNSDALPADELLNRLVAAVGTGNGPAGVLLKALREPEPSFRLPDSSVLSDESLPNWARNNLRLYFAQWLSDREYYNEAMEELKQLKPTDVVDPAGLLFYQSVSHHRLLDREQCLPTLKSLLDNENEIPRRYAKTAKLMLSDIGPLKADSLDEVSRLMDNIKVRLKHGRAGKRVRKEEDDVIAKLDKMIEDLEEQARKGGSGAGGGSQGRNQPSAPMEDSIAARANGPGNVDPKKLGSRTDWGNLPPKEREEALQKLSKDLPTHYRDVIEEYFHKLAKDEAQ